MHAQHGSLFGRITDSEGKAIELAAVSIPELNKGDITDQDGNFTLGDIPFGNWDLHISALAYEVYSSEIAIQQKETFLQFSLNRPPHAIHEVVISGTMKEISKLDSPVPVEVYSSEFFKSNPTPSLFDALQTINGVQPQVNCSVCNTGDIHINGLEGPYTMILIDGMPIVSGLSTVYGLSGIPQSLIDRVEIVKGPASTLYGSEAVGGLINVITKTPINSPLLSADIFATNWQEINADFSTKMKIGHKAHSLLGLNYFNYQNPVDNNHDGFTDLTLQHRISIFNKWDMQRKENRIFSLAGRYVYEDRWGGEMNWTKNHRGSDEIYGESVFTNRWELFGKYQLPLRERIIFQWSANGHHHNSFYGTTPYTAVQHIGFGQLIWDKKIKNHDILAGISYRYNSYDDNTTATASFQNPEENQVSHASLPGGFIQNEININESNKLLLGLRYDYNSKHGGILTPRINYKWNTPDKNNTLRLSFGNGYRIAHVFTEDHAALTGARELVFLDDLKPETSWNGNINFVKNIYTTKGTFIGFDASVFYTYFHNKIIPDYETDVQKIIYDNLNGHAVSKGISLNIDMLFKNGLKILAGATYMDVYSQENGNKNQQLFTERFSATWNIGYSFKKIGTTIDYTGNLYSPMRLPLISEHDPRREYSPWWSIQNIQLSHSFNRITIYGGIKNLLNWTPNKGNPFLIARANDPFDKKVQFDGNGQPVITPENPYGLKFDPDYIYASNQGIRAFLGMRYTIK